MALVICFLAEQIWQLDVQWYVWLLAGFDAISR